MLNAMKSNGWASVVSAIGLVATLAACDKSGSSASQQQAPTAGAAAPAVGKATGAPSCALVSTAEVTSLTGIAGLKDVEKNGDPPVTSCSYARGLSLFAVSIRYETGRDAAQFAIIRKGHDDHDQKTIDLPSFAPGAFRVTVGQVGALGGQVNAICFLHKNTAVYVGGGAPLDKIEALARVVMQRM